MFARSATYQFAATVCGKPLQNAYDSSVFNVNVFFKVNLISISYGTMAGWPSASFLVLESAKESPLESGPLNTDQLSWIGSLLGVGGLCGAIFFGWLSDQVGRKVALALVAFPAIVRIVHHKYGRISK